VLGIERSVSERCIDAKPVRCKQIRVLGFELIFEEVPASALDQVCFAMRDRHEPSEYDRKSGFRSKDVEAVGEIDRNGYVQRFAARVLE
jgi:hypothetical protein